MAADDLRLSPPIAGVPQLVQTFHDAGKPRADWRVGGEHEKIGVIVDPARGTPGAAPAYAGGPASISALFADLIAHDWAPVEEHGHVIAALRDGASVTLEPGGQTELSGAPHASLLTLEAEFDRHRHEMVELARAHGIAWLAVGFRPLGTLDDVPWMPKGRYAIMREYLPTRGKLALEMMKRTATVQANLDWADEADAQRKFVAAMSVTSLVTAIYANSPVVNGRDTGYQSYRASIWLDTDPDRCGIPPFSFTPGADGFFARYVEWALDVPMFFVSRPAWGGYRAAGGMTFRRFLADGFQGERATLADWQLHLSTLFPETRLKTYLEVRGADAGSQAMVLALPALWKGLLYDDAACREASALTAHLAYEERLALREQVPRTGLATGMRSAGGGQVGVLELARQLVAIARAGLTRVAPDEVRLLAPLDEVVTTGRAPAERVREAFAGWAGDVGKLVEKLGL
jgi:glutamate--cysteine ligase